jgi:lantibiotic biosynthesis protein
MSNDSYLDVALLIGEQVAAAAIWSGDRCSWVGGMPEEGPMGIAMTYAAFGPDLYGGTAGVGLALAELFAAAGGEHRALRQTALGALEHALARAHELPPPLRLGAYSGQLGVALCAARAGAVLGETALVERAGSLASGLDYGAEPLEQDLMAGRAGGIVALLTLGRLGAADAPLERAAELGRDLIDAAHIDESGWSWATPSLPAQRHLTGLSHGAAGIGAALLELHRATGDGDFRAAAQGAFAYERSLFDPVAGNWPDLREGSLRGRLPGAPPPCATLWCHGAPGIALARLRALELGAGNGYEPEARQALETTAQSVRAQLAGGNYSLCHGLAGNSEVLSEGTRLLDADAARLPRDVADAGVERYLEPGAPWPGGVYNGHTDSLFLGRAGTAYFYLRLHDPSRPSLLLLRPESFG